jgi:hypothetical protein
VSGSSLTCGETGQRGRLWSLSDNESIADKPFAETRTSKCRKEGQLCTFSPEPRRLVGLGRMRAGELAGLGCGGARGAGSKRVGVAGNLSETGDQGPERDVRMVFSDAAGWRRDCYVGSGWAARRVSGFWGCIRSRGITWCHYRPGRSGVWGAESGSVAASSWDATRWVTAHCTFTLSNDLGRPGARRG